MEVAVKAAWMMLAVIHASPAVVLFAPALTERLYGIDPTGTPGILIAHRGALFLAVVALALWAMFDPAIRRAAGLAVTISVLGFLSVYARAGWPAGPLRFIALADLIALIPLALVKWSAWKG